jgi:transposase
LRYRRPIAQAAEGASVADLGDTAPPLARGRTTRALDLASKPRVGRAIDWPVLLPLPGSERLPGRVVAVRLPKPLAGRARERARRASAKKHHQVHPHTLEAAGFVLLFTTLPTDQAPASMALELYRHRWQIELTFKWLKQLLRIGRLPHQHPGAATGSIQAKLVAPLLVETLFRNARNFSPWGYPLENGEAA